MDKDKNMEQIAMIILLLKTIKDLTAIIQRDTPATDEELAKVKFIRQKAVKLVLDDIGD
jgi:hypothetical protein